MSRLFLYGTLRDPELRRIVLGPEGRDISLSEAVLADHAVTCAVQGVVSIKPEPGAETAGLLLVEPDPVVLARLAFYAGGFDLEPRPLKVRAGGAVLSAQAYALHPGLCPAGAPFDLTAWQETTGALARYAASEAMGYLGRFTAAELAARMPMIRARAASRVAATGVAAELRSATSAGAVERIGAEVLHVDYFRSEALSLRHPQFRGGMSPTIRREVFVATDAALVLPYDPRRDRVLLVEQFRMGPYGRGDPRPWMLEPVAGRVDPGETAEEAAHRECREEAGLTAIRLEHIASYYCTPGYSTEYFHSFVGLTDLPDTLPRYGGVASEVEDIRLHLLDFSAAMGLLESGEADNGPLILALMWLARERARLRRAA